MRDITVVHPRYRFNEARWDRALRAVGGGALLWVGAGPLAGTVLGILLSTVGSILAMTGLVGWCPLYAILGIRTDCAPAVDGETGRETNERETPFHRLGSHPPRR